MLPEKPVKGQNPGIQNENKQRTTRASRVFIVLLLEAERENVAVRRSE